MFLIPMKSIKKDFDAAMRKAGYVRASEKCAEWDVTAKQLSAIISKGWECDQFVVNGVRYIHKNTSKPYFPSKDDKIWPIDYM